MARPASQNEIADAARPLISALEKLVRVIGTEAPSPEELGRYSRAISEQHKKLQGAITSHRDGPERTTGQPIS